MSPGPSTFSQTDLSIPSRSFTFPFAPSPEIILSHQIDNQQTSLLHSHLTHFTRSLYGSRITQTRSSEISTLSALLYFCLTTLLGNRTLGEEYTDIVQVAEWNGDQLPAFGRRAGFVVAHVVVPYLLTKVMPRLRQRIRERLERKMRRAQSRDGDGDGNGKIWRRKLQEYVLEHLVVLTSPAPVYAVSLATFYFTGGYYHLSKRLLGLRYVFTKKLPPEEQRVGYEVLGVLLVLQILVQGWMHISEMVKSTTEEMEKDKEGTEIGTLTNGAPRDTVARRIRIENVTHTPVLDEKPRYDLRDKTMMSWIQGKQLRKCTLCLEEMKDPSATTCGHVFCWTCIKDWVKEKPECPLCRQGALGQHILPLRG